MTTRKLGLFLPSNDALRLSTQLERIHDLAGVGGPLSDMAGQALSILQSGEVGEFQVCATGPTGSGDQRSDLTTYAAALKTVK